MQDIHLIIVLVRLFALVFRTGNSTFIRSYKKADNVYFVLYLMEYIFCFNNFFHGNSVHTHTFRMKIFR